MSLIDNVQEKIKTGSSSLGLLIFKSLTGLFLGVTLAIIGHELSGYGTISYWFVVAVTTAVFMKISKPWSVTSVVIFNLVCFLVGLVLRMYILIAPGA